MNIYFYFTKQKTKKQKKKKNQMDGVGSWAQNHTMGRGALAESVVVRVEGGISPRTS